MNQTSPKGVKAWGKAPWGRRKSPGAETHTTGSVPDWSELDFLVLELLPYMVDGLAHYAEKVGTIYQPLRSGRIWHKVDF